MTYNKHIQSFNEHQENLNISDVISSKTKSEILKVIEDLDKRGNFYIFNNREDFVEGRTDWEELKDTAENLYYAIENIKDLLNKG
jgi:uncharacterized protein YprB with RNaseH-like and TPR domain